MSREPSPTAAERLVREHVEAIRRRELDRALARLEAAGGTNPAQRRVLEELSTALVDDLVDPGAVAELPAGRRRRALELLGATDGSDSLLVASVDHEDGSE